MTRFDRRPPNRPSLDPEAIAIEALGFLAAEPERLDRFLALTGLDPASLRTAAGESGFTAALLSYLASDDTVLLAFAQATGRSAQALGQMVRAVAEAGARGEDG